MSVTVELYVPNNPKIMCHTKLVLYFHAVTSFDLTFDMYLALASYLHGIFVVPSVAFWQVLGLQLYLVLSR